MIKLAPLVVAALGCGGSTARAPAPVQAAPATAAPAPVPSPPAPAPLQMVAPAVSPHPMSVAWTKTAEGAPNWTSAVAVRADGSVLLAGSDDGSGWKAKTRHTKPMSHGAVVSLAADGSTQWVRELGTAEIQSLAALPDGGAIACGNFTGTLVLAGKKIGKAAADHELVVIALDPTGNVRWTFHAGSAGYNACNDVALTSEGYVAFVGVISGETRFGELPAHSIGRRDAFVAMLEANGSPRWVAISGSTEDDEARSVAVTGPSIYVTGYFGGAASFGHERLALPTGPSRNAANPSNMFLARYSASGETYWAKSYGYPDSFDTGWSVTALSDGDAAVVGQISQRGFIARYTATGDRVWLHETSEDCAPRTVVALPHDDLLVGIYFGWPQAGHDLTLGRTTLTAVGSDTALARYSPSGDLLATAQISGATPHTNGRDGSEVEISDAAIAPGGRIVLTGRLWGSAVLDPGTLLVAHDLKLAVPGEHGSIVLALDQVPAE